MIIINTCRSTTCLFPRRTGFQGFTSYFSLKLHWGKVLMRPDVHNFTGSPFYSMKLKWMVEHWSFRGTEYMNDVQKSNALATTRYYTCITERSAYEHRKHCALHQLESWSEKLNMGWNSIWWRQLWSSYASNLQCFCKICTKLYFLVVYSDATPILVFHAMSVNELYHQRVYKYTCTY
jgi:hypothetical protein